jgi:hypothetical protein
MVGFRIIIISTSLRHCELRSSEATQEYFKNNSGLLQASPSLVTAAIINH